MPRRLHYRATGIIALLVLVWVSSGARAQESDDPGRERAGAEALFEAGHAAMDAGDYDTACQKFEASLELDPAPGTLMNLGNCEEKRGRFASAWERYIAAERELPEDDRRAEFAREKIVELDPKVPRLTIVLAEDAPETTEVRRESVNLTGSLGVALPLDPGSYVIEAKAEGYEPRHFDVELAAGETRELVVEPGDALPAASSATGGDQPENFGPLTKRQWGYVAGGIGIAGVVTALTAGGFAYQKKKVMDEHCDGPSRQCDPIGYDARETGATLATVANLAGGIGIVGLGAGTFLILTSDPPNGEARASTRPNRLRNGGFTARLEWSSGPASETVQLKGEFW
jgi:hypothetical protein